MRYLIKKTSDELLFYVDRNKTKRFWWSYDLSFAMYFTSQSEAQRVADNLKFGVFTVIDEDRARLIRKWRDREHEMHRIDYDNYSEPFSNEDSYQHSSYD